jgi:hypothetical protein
MNRTIAGVIGTTLCTAAFTIMTGQVTGAAQSQTSSSQATPTAADQQVTVTGCIQNEADFRKSTGAGRGGVASTGVGVANEFVLANAMMSPSSSRSATGTSGAGAPSATGTAGSATSNTAYELTGPNEGQAATHVGKRVEIMGKMKATTGAGGPTGNVVGSADLKLPELEISSIRETTGSCTATPATP